MRHAIIILTLAAAVGCTAPAGDSTPTTTVNVYEEAEQAIEEAQTTVKPETVDSSQSCDQIGHPYPAQPGDPHDGDNDGNACEDND